MKFVTDEAIINSDGEYTYKVMHNKDDKELQNMAKQWLQTNNPSHYIVTDEDVISHIKMVLNVQGIECNDDLFIMEPGEEALVVRKCPVNPSPETFRATGESVAKVRARWEYGVLKRIK